MFLAIIIFSVLVIVILALLRLNDIRFGKVEGPTSQGAIDHFDLAVVYEGARTDALVVLGTLGSMGFEARLSEELRDTLFLTSNVHPIQVSVPREQAEEAITALEQAREVSPGADDARASAGE